jgi:hypothetical protein
MRVCFFLVQQGFMRLPSVVILALAACAAFVAPHTALAWGSSGHRMIGQLAVQAFPPELPAFLRTPAAASTLGELAREPDRSKGAGRTHDADLDPAHYLDVDDHGRVLGASALAELPATRAEFEAALRASGTDGWRAGYLPYAIVEGWQQLTRDFAYWRVETAAARMVPDPRHRTWLAADASRRQALILNDLGDFAHYVGDGSQPLHVTVHFNGWGDYPDPERFTQARIHAYFEGEFVRRFVEPRAVATRLPPYQDCRCGIWPRTEAYLAATNAEVLPLYRLDKAGAFVHASPEGRAFVAARLAVGAAMLRDMVVDAWRASAEASVGYPAVKVADVLAGKLDPYDSLFGLD